MARRSRLSAALPLAALAAAHCRPAPASSVAPARTAPAPIAPDVAAPEPPRDLVADALAGRGALHGPRIEVPALGDRPAGTLAFVGTPATAYSAFLVLDRSPAAPDPVPVHRWPAGTRVLAGVVDRDGTAYVLIETLALREQPAGLRAVLALRLALANHELASPVAAERARFASVRDAAALTAALAAPNPAPAAPPALPSSPSCRAVTALAEAPALAAAIAPGARFVPMYQNAIPGASAPLTAEALDGARTALVRQALRLAAAGGCCAGSCGGPVANGNESDELFVELGADPARPTRPVISALMASASAPAPPSARTPLALVERAPSTAPALAAYARAALPFGAVALGAAPLDARGQLAVYRAPDGALIAVVLEDGAPRALEFVAPAPSEPGVQTTLSFAELNGDARTDVVLWVGTPGAPAVLVQGFTTPPGLGRSFMATDNASAYAMVGATDADAAARAAVALPLRGVSAREACALVAQARTPEGFARVSAPGARVVSYDEPGLLGFHAATSPPMPAPRIELRYPCSGFQCAADRPYCWAHDASHPGPDGDGYFFRWDGARLQLAGVATYGGS